MPLGLEDIDEIWMPVFDFEGFYEISNLGRIRSVTRFIWRKTPRDKEKMYFKKYPGKILSLSIEKNKNNIPIRSFVSLSKNNKVYQKRIHRLVLETFIGLCPAGMQGCHNDGNPLNNNIKNLRWDTPKENQKDKIRHGRIQGQFKKNSNRADGTRALGEDVTNSKLTEKIILEIRSLSSYTGINTDLAKEFNVHKSTIKSIRSRRTWKHI